MKMPTADERPPEHSKPRTWLWASLTAVVFFGAGLATIAWASERPHDQAPAAAGVTDHEGD
jgi:hypothetical protein